MLLKPQVSSLLKASALFLTCWFGAQWGYRVPFQMCGGIRAQLAGLRTRFFLFFRGKNLQLLADNPSCKGLLQPQPPVRPRRTLLAGG